MSTWKPITDNSIFFIITPNWEQHNAFHRWMDTMEHHSVTEAKNRFRHGARIQTEPSLWVIPAQSKDNRKKLPNQPQSPASVFQPRPPTPQFGNKPFPSPTAPACIRQNFTSLRKGWCVTQQCVNSTHNKQLNQVLENPGSSHWI